MLQLALCALMGANVAGSAGVPFPSETVTVKTPGFQFEVAGRQALPRNVKVALLRKGEVRGTPVVREDGTIEEAVIEISGNLQMLPLTDGAIVLHDVWLELTPECRSLELYNVQFRGDGGIRPSEEGASKADISLEHVRFPSPSTLSLACESGTITVFRSSSYLPVKLMGVKRSKGADSSARMRLIKSNFNREPSGLDVSGFKEALILLCRIDGTKSRFADNAKLSFEHNNVRSQSIEFAYSKTGQFKRATISGCDFRSKEVAFLAPPNDGKTERLTVKRCYFSSGTDAGTILASQVRDASRSKETSAQVTLTQINESPLGFAGD